jgi:hypothetical protein
MKRQAPTLKRTARETQQAFEVLRGAWCVKIGDGSPCGDWCLVIGAYLVPGAWDLVLSVA